LRKSQQCSSPKEYKGYIMAYALSAYCANKSTTTGTPSDSIAWKITTLWVWAAASVAGGHKHSNNNARASAAAASTMVCDAQYFAFGGSACPAYQTQATYVAQCIFEQNSKQHKADKS